MTSTEELAIEDIDLNDMDQDDLMGSSWARDLCMPIPGTSMGEDPRYGDRYVEIKHEIDKLSDTDYKRVFELSKEILMSEAKDLRVAGYLVLSAAYVEGVHGLADAIKVYYVILDKFWNDCYPKVEMARANTISWINNKKIAYFLERRNDDFDQTLLDKLKARVDAFNRLISKRTEGKAQTFTEINSWIDQAQHKVDEHNRQLESERDQRLKLEREKQQQEKELALLEQLQDEEHKRQDQVRALAERLLSEDAHQKIVVQCLVSRLLLEKKFLPAVMYMAACQWSITEVSHSDGENTDIEFPQDLDIQSLQAIENVEERFRTCIDSLMLANAGFCFTLTQIAYEAAREMYDKELAATIKQLVGDLLDRFPELLDLKFSNGIEFAEEDCREWLNDILSSRTDINPLTAFAGNSNDTSDIDLALDRAREIVHEEDLKAGIRYISGLSVADELSRVKQKLNMAILCVESERTDLALPVLNEMFNYTNSFSLHIWQPALAMLLWQTLHSVLMAEKETASDILKDKIEERLNTISEKMCTADLSMASQLLN